MVPTEHRTGPGSAASTSNERELELLHKIAQRDRAAFRELYLIYHRRLARFLMRITSHHELVEEVINDTLWTVWQKASDFRGASRVSTWIVGIAYRRALKALRQAKPAALATSDDAAAEGATTDPQVENETSEWLHRALAELPLEQRLAVEFCYLLGHSCEEIAEIMGCPVNTVKTRMFHAREKLRHSLPRLAGSDRDGEQ
jgi:RNA polymerase sigma-70 factor, ECF subfamily